MVSIPLANTRRSRHAKNETKRFKMVLGGPSTLSGITRVHMCLWVVIFCVWAKSLKEDREKVMQNCFGMVWEGPLAPSTSLESNHVCVFCFRADCGIVLFRFVWFCYICFVFLCVGHVLLCCLLCVVVLLCFVLLSALSCITMFCFRLASFVFALLFVPL